MRSIGWSLILSLGLFWGSLSADERADFLNAQSALAQGRQADYTKLRARLDTYLLAPYLDYWALRKRLPRLTTTEVADFLNLHPSTWFAEALRQAWLEQLADAARWDDYLQFAQPVGEGVVSQCRHRYALLQTGRAAEAWPGMTTLWLQGKPQAAPCEPLFDAWIAADMHAPAQIEQRLLLALAANELTLAKGLQRKLPAARQAWGEQALRIYAAPTAGLRTGATLPPELGTVALAHLAASDAPAALDAWEEGAVQSPLTTQQQSEVAQAIHKGLLKQQPAGLLALLARLPAATLPVRAQEERLRQALSVQAWARVAEWAAALPETSTAEEWRYWQAHALEQTGQNTAALAKFTALARERTFYGFLAADRTGQSYDFATTPLAADPALQAELAARPALRRLREALALQLEPEAKHEWAAVFPALDETQAQLAIRLLDQWDWPDQAQFALAKRGFWRDLEFRFPVRHLREVQTAAAAQQLDPAWIYAVIRQESVFNPQALSGANARGLMQLLPETAKATARRVGLAAPSAAALFQPEANITLGAAYLRQMLNRLDGHLALATAAYNAGPGRPKKWRQDAPADAALWVELIPFRETRGYVKRVLSYRVLYQWRLGLPVQRISTALTDVRP